MNSIEKMLNLIEILLFEGKGKVETLSFKVEELTGTDFSVFELQKNLLRLKEEGCIIGFYSDTTLMPDAKNLRRTVGPFNFSIVPNYPRLEEYKTELMSLSFGRSKQNKVVLVISENKGIYLKENKNKSYPIKSNRRRLVYLLRDNTLPAKLLFEIKNPPYTNLQDLSKAVNQTNKQFRERVFEYADIILHAPTGGYYLNRDIFSIEWENHSWK